jgi:hypothetical protein
MLGICSAFFFYKKRGAWKFPRTGRSSRARFRFATQSAIGHPQSVKGTAHARVFKTPPSSFDAQNLVPSFCCHRPRPGHCGARAIGAGILVKTTGKFQLKSSDDWLNEDQSATRKGSVK